MTTKTTESGVVAASAAATLATTTTTTITTQSSGFRARGRTVTPVTPGRTFARVVMGDSGHPIAIESLGSVTAITPPLSGHATLTTDTLTTSVCESPRSSWRIPPPTSEPRPQPQPWLLLATPPRPETEVVEHDIPSPTYWIPPTEQRGASTPEEGARRPLQFPPSAQPTLPALVKRTLFRRTPLST
jgi:hypothetical protein